MNVVPNLEQAIDQFHQLALKDFMQQLIAALKKYYSFEEILQALADYTKDRGDWAEVTGHIQAARLVVLEVSARLRGGEVDEDDENSNI